ncbi:MAG TPA: hypothetical protein PK175_09060 [Syntrophales bacterium]|nr:hypothetical protein [Syntrophales bacterium]HPC32377.1 hypothetical protein [Syntrophales bacterium]HQG35007.1 hypothetical protein [Syntrophales bacterium]HQI36601.1 hypothetical protein [Syntrophales bacterium]HQJ30502.1 hypothetical protein [Syntrophales bacterium]
MLKKSPITGAVTLVMIIILAACAGGPRMVNVMGQRMQVINVEPPKGGNIDPIDERLKKDGVILLSEWKAARAENKDPGMAHPVVTVGDGEESLKLQGITLEPPRTSRPEMSMIGRPFVYILIRFPREVELEQIRKSFARNVVTELLTNEESAFWRERTRLCKWQWNMTAVARPDYGRLYFGPMKADRRLDASTVGREGLYFLYLNQESLKRPEEDPCSKAEALKLIRKTAESFNR